MYINIYIYIYIYIYVVIKEKVYNVRFNATLKEVKSWK